MNSKKLLIDGTLEKTDLLLLATALDTSLGGIRSPGTFRRTFKTVPKYINEAFRFLLSLTHKILRLYLVCFLLYMSSCYSVQPLVAWLDEPRRGESLTESQQERTTQGENHGNY